jgi:beta-glucosidase
VENDGSPLYPFGYGLSYTTFALDNYTCETCGDHLTVSLTVENTGDLDGAEVVQIYLSGRNCDVVMPRIELKAYKRAFVRAGETVTVTAEVPADAFHYYNRKMVYGMHNGDYTVSVGTSCMDLHHKFEVKVRDGKLL